MSEIFLIGQAEQKHKDLLLCQPVKKVVPATLEKCCNEGMIKDNLKTSCKKLKLYTFKYVSIYA